MSLKEPFDRDKIKIKNKKALFHSLVGGSFLFEFSVHIMDILKSETSSAH